MIKTFLKTLLCTMPHMTSVGDGIFVSAVMMSVNVIQNIGIGNLIQNRDRWSSVCVCVCVCVYVKC